MFKSIHNKYILELYPNNQKKEVVLSLKGNIEYKFYLINKIWKKRDIPWLITPHVISNKTYYTTSSTETTGPLTWGMPIWSRR